MNKVSLVVLFGLPASGKSTLSEDVSEALHRRGIHVQTFCYDRLMTRADQQKDAYRSRRREILAEVQAAVEALKKTPLKHLVLIDDNMYYRSMRRHYHGLCKSLGIGFGMVLVDCRPGVAWERNCRRPAESAVPKEVFDGMVERFERPGKELWEADCYTVDTEAPVGLEELASFCCASFDKVPKAEEVRDCGQAGDSALHQLDLALRRVVSDKLKGGQVVAQPILQRRQAIVSDCTRFGVDLSQPLDHDYLHRLFDDL